MVGDGEGVFLASALLPRLSIGRPVMEKVDDGATESTTGFEIEVLKVLASETGLEDRLKVSRRVWPSRYFGWHTGKHRWWTAVENLQLAKQQCQQKCHLGNV